MEIVKRLKRIFDFKHSKKRFWLTLRDTPKKGHWWTRGTTAALNVTTRCPYTCDYCPMYIYGAVKRYKECTVDEWKLFIERYAHWLSRIYISGGEPSLYSDIVPLVNWLVERGSHVIIFTNLWKVENFLAIKPHWRLLFMPTFHADDEQKFAHGRPVDERFNNAVKTLEDNGFQVSTQQIFENEHGFWRKKEFFTVDYFKHFDDTIQFVPDSPRSLKMYLGSIEMYRNDLPEKHKEMNFLEEKK